MNAPAAGQRGQRLLFELVHAIVSTFAVTAAAELGLADALTGHPRTSKELARTLAVHEASLRRLLRMLAAANIVREEQPGRFGLTPDGVALQSGSAGSVQPALGMLERFMLPALQQTAHNIRTGEAGFTRIFGAPLYDYLEQHGDAAEDFSQALRSFQALFPSVLDAYDFTDVHTLVDVGGGEGWRLVEILGPTPTCRASCSTDLRWPSRPRRCWPTPVSPNGPRSSGAASSTRCQRAATAISSLWFSQTGTTPRR
jgi:hypothetical protein